MERSFHQPRRASPMTDVALVNCKCKYESTSAQFEALLYFTTRLEYKLQDANKKAASVLILIGQWDDQINNLLRFKLTTQASVMCDFRNEVAKAIRVKTKSIKSFFHYPK